jgi:hypothetical protein
MVRADPLSVAESPDLTVAGVLRTVTVFPPIVLPGYDRLVHMIQDAFPRARVDEVLPGRPRDLRADVVLFPYDFRHGVRAAALRLQGEIEMRLGSLSRRDRSQRVIVIGHSMGGLVARYWAGPLGGSPDCLGLITVATPHRGVPKALDWLVNGVHIGRVQMHSMTEVSRTWQGVYDLLPQYPAILSSDARNASGRSRPAIGPLEIGGIAAAGFLKRATAASDMHAEIDMAWRELGERGSAPLLTAVFAKGHATPSRTVLVDGKLRISKIDPEWLPHAGWRGDGTVPAISAVPPELKPGSAALRQVPERHLPMAATPAVVALLRACDGEAPRPSAPHHAAAPPVAGAWLGITVDKVVPAGAPVGVVAEVLGGPADDTTRVCVHVTGADGSYSIPCDRSGDRWLAEVPGQRAGACSITVSAARVPGVGVLARKDVLNVMALP